LCWNFLHQSNVNDYFSIAWSLSVEEWFYLLFSPFLFVAASAVQRSSVTAAAIAAVLFVILITTLRAVFGDDTRWGPDVRRVAIFRIDSIGYGFLLYLAPWPVLLFVYLIGTVALATLVYTALEAPVLSTRPGFKHGANESSGRGR
jgi:peptidoglycan/LPS O-acetylase OafA/YrhL